MDNLSSKCLNYQKQLMDKRKTEEICQHLRSAQSELQERYDFLQERCKILKIKNEELSKVHSNRESYHAEKQKTLKDMHDLYDKMKKTLEKSEKSNQEKTNRKTKTNTCAGDLQSNSMVTNSDHNSPNLDNTTRNLENNELTTREENESQTEAIKTKHSQQEIARLKRLQAARDRQKALLDKSGFVKLTDKATLQENKTQLKGNNSHTKQLKSKTTEKSDKFQQSRPERSINIRTVSKNPFYQSSIKNLL